MQISDVDESLIGRYVLGMLPEADTERLDAASIEDDGFAARLEAAEQDLIDGYVRRTLPAASMPRFESHYLASAGRRERVALADAFLGAVDRVAARAHADAAVQRRGRTLSMVVAVAVAVLVAAAAAAFIEISRPAPDAVTHAGRPRPGEALTDATQPAEAFQARAKSVGAPLRQLIATEVVEASIPIALVLLPATRAMGQLPSAGAPLFGEPFAVQLQLASRQAAEYRVALKDPASDRVLWRSDRLLPGKSDAASITVAIPANLLRAQRYWLELAASRGAPDSDTSTIYAFQILP